MDVREENGRERRAAGAVVFMATLRIIQVGTSYLGPKESYIWSFILMGAAFVAWVFVPYKDSKLGNDESSIEKLRVQSKRLEFSSIVITALLLLSYVPRVIGEVKEGRFIDLGIIVAVVMVSIYLWMRKHRNSKKS